MMQCPACEKSVEALYCPACGMKEQLLRPNPLLQAIADGKVKVDRSSGVFGRAFVVPLNIPRPSFWLRVRAWVRRLRPRQLRFWVALRWPSYEEVDQVRLFHSRESRDALVRSGEGLWVAWPDREGFDLGIEVLP